MSSHKSLIQARLRAPKAAAIAGIVFSVLMIISLGHILLALPDNLNESRVWLSAYGQRILLALNLLPFAGIAFLWFMGVVHDRMGERQDRFLVTVFFGSGLLFLGLLFIFAAMSGSVILLYRSQENLQLGSGFYAFGITFARNIMNIYVVRMAGVFMISTSSLFIRTQAIPRWIAFLGFGLAVLMLLRIGHIGRIGWVILSFPLWILLVSIYILIDNYRRQSKIAAT
jgi:hypothetical protein